MATDEREWTVSQGGWYRGESEGMRASGSDLSYGEVVPVVPKSRLVAAEQRVGELEKERDSLERRLRDAEGEARLFRGAKKDAEAKLATAVEALEFYAQIGRKARQALSNIKGKQ